MHNFEHLRDFNIVQLREWIEKYLRFVTSRNPAVDVEAAFTFAHFINDKIDEIDDSRLWSLELCGLHLEYLGIEASDGKLWAATFHAVAECVWFEDNFIHKYPASSRAACVEEAIARAGAIAGAMLMLPESDNRK